MNKLVLAVVLILVLAIAYVLFRPQSTTPTTSNNSMMKQTSSGASVDPEEGSLREITVEAKNFSFNPTTINVKKGNKVRIFFKSTGGPHDFVIDEFNLDRIKTQKDGFQEVITFTADKTGTFEYYCSIGNHRAMGMKGTLIVE